MKIEFDVRLQRHMRRRFYRATEFAMDCGLRIPKHGRHSSFGGRYDLMCARKSKTDWDFLKRDPWGRIGSGYLIDTSQLFSVPRLWGDKLMLYLFTMMLPYGHKYWLNGLPVMPMYVNDIVDDPFTWERGKMSVTSKQVVLNFSKVV